MKKITIVILFTHALASSAAHAQMNYKFSKDEAYVEPSQIIVKSVCLPEWPASSLKNNETGTVELSLLMNTEGIIVRAKIVETSGFRDLDRATMRGFIGCQFKPVIEDGIAVESWRPMKYVWKLE